MRTGKNNAVLSGVAVALPGARRMSAATTGVVAKFAVVQYTPVESTASVKTFI